MAIIVNNKADLSCNFTYPLVKQSVVDNMIVLFSGLREGMVVSVGNGPHSIGFHTFTWICHTDNRFWKDVSITLTSN